MKGDRRLVEYQKKYEQRIQFLMNKLRDAESNEAPDERITYVELETEVDRWPFLGNCLRHRRSLSKRVWLKVPAPISMVDL